ncbi:polymeric immunoglobulin receptor-like [Fundulus heteroclitus]|uniref:polymeric immunoglobulin receptor-like n=1 Tax=Fundulus heteroclitus TaxID=8078 RepID=UPI00165A64B6|nr:polymeric immunoglobulin receptor-like [Fundulus heteroclitus]
MNFLSTSLQLQCDKTEIRAHIGGEFIIVCKFDLKKFLFSKKYWCRGASRNNCDILRDTDGFVNTKYRNRLSIFDTRSGGLVVKVTNLQIEDSDVYWIGIDKMYADIMTSIKVTVTQVPVSKPNLWPLTPLKEGPTCWGKQVTIRCGCTEGTDVLYAWYQHVHHKSFLLLSSSDLSLHCGVVMEDSEYYCSASNSISSEQSDILSVQVLMPDNSSCIYVVNIQGQPVYDCAGRLSTTMAETSPTTCIETTKIPSGTSEQCLLLNKTTLHAFFNRAWTGVPLWYELLRWGSFTLLLIYLCIFITCTQTSHEKHDRSRKRFNVR